LRSTKARGISLGLEFAILIVAARKLILSNEGPPEEHRMASPAIWGTRFWNLLSIVVM
jgi:hypothetical protein